MEGLLDDDCFAIRQSARYVSQLYVRHLAKVGLTITQFSLLGRLKRTGPLTMKQLAEAMRMQRTTLVRTIQPLRRNGLVSSAALGADARALTIALTAMGEERLNAGRKHWYSGSSGIRAALWRTARGRIARARLFALTRDSI